MPSSLEHCRGEEEEDDSQHVTEDVIGALAIWEKKNGNSSMIKVYHGSNVVAEPQLKVES